MKWMSILGALVMSLACPALSLAQETKTPAPADKGEVENGRNCLFFQAEGHLSLLSDTPDSSVFAASRGGAFRVGYRWSHWGAFFHAGQNRWLTSETDQMLTLGVANVGIGGEYHFFDDRVRASVTTGTSTLLFETALHEVGYTGYFLDLRPGGIRWFPLDWLVLEFHPMSFTVMAPVLVHPRLVHLEYRTAFIMEFRL